MAGPVGQLLQKLDAYVQTQHKELKDKQFENLSKKEVKKVAQDIVIRQKGDQYECEKKSWFRRLPGFKWLRYLFPTPLYEKTGFEGMIDVAGKQLASIKADKATAAEKNLQTLLNEIVKTRTKSGMPIEFKKVKVAVKTAQPKEQEKAGDAQESDKAPPVPSRDLKPKFLPDKPAPLPPKQKPAPKPPQPKTVSTTSDSSTPKQETTLDKISQQGVNLLKPPSGVSGLTPISKKPSPVKSTKATPPTITPEQQKAKEVQQQAKAKAQEAAKELDAYAFFLGEKTAKESVDPKKDYFCVLTTGEEEILQTGRLDSFTLNRIFSKLFVAMTSGNESAQKQANETLCNILQRNMYGKSNMLNTLQQMFKYEGYNSLIRLTQKTYEQVFNDMMTQFGQAQGNRYVPLVTLLQNIRDMPLPSATVKFDPNVNKQYDAIRSHLVECFQKQTLDQVLVDKKLEALNKEIAEFTASWKAATTPAKKTQKK